VNVIVMIEGREAIPVRAIPWLTNWETMSPDAVALALAWDEHFFRFAGLQAHRIEGESIRPIRAIWWENIASHNLNALSDSIRATEITHETGLRAWRRESLEELPAGVFVWKDEFETLHGRRYGPEGMSFLTESGDVMTENEQEGRVRLGFDPFISDPEIGRLVMEGFEPKTAAPTPEKSPAGGDDGASKPNARLAMMLRKMNSAEYQQALATAEAAVSNAGKTPEDADQNHKALRGDYFGDVERPAVQQAAPANPLQRFLAQEAAILNAIKQAGHNPLALPENEPGKAGVKSEIRKTLKGNSLFIGSTVFDKAWERLQGSGEIVAIPRRVSP